MRLSTCACTDTSSALTGSSADDQLRPRDQRARDRDALALAAGELVRVLGGVARAQADRIERSGDTLALLAGRPRRSAVSAYDRPTRWRGSERAVRVLEHHLEVAPRLHQARRATSTAGRAPQQACSRAGGRLPRAPSRASPSVTCP
jgi:hypothetical protein